MNSTIKHSGEAELSLAEVVDTFNAYKWQFLFFVLTTTLACGVAALLLPKRYDATVLLSPVSNSSTNGLLSGISSAVSQLGGLASLAGLPQSSDSTKAESLAALQSEVLTETYIQRNNLLPILYENRWDASAHRWKNDGGKTPTLWEGNQLWNKKVRSVSSDSKSGLVTLTIRWKDAVTAAKWANGLVQMTNEFRRDKAIRESERNIAYLTDEAVKTDVVGVKQAIYSILQTEISKVMLARGNEEYALKVIDPAIPPEKPSSPLLVYWLLAGCLGSGGLGLGLIFLRAAMTRD